LPNRRVVEAARDLGVFLDRRAGDIGDETRLGEIEGRQDVAHHMIGAGVLQADGVEHAHRRLVDPVRRVAEPSVERRSLEHHRAAIGVREAFDAGVLLAEADAAREQHDGRGEVHPQKSVAQRGGRRAGRGGRDGGQRGVGGHGSDYSRWASR
jgi:hypothetical protein